MAGRNFIIDDIIIARRKRHFPVSPVMNDNTDISQIGFARPGIFEYSRSARLGTRENPELLLSTMEGSVNLNGGPTRGGRRSKLTRT